MGVYDPFRPDVEAHVRSSLTHLHRVTLIPRTGPRFELQVTEELDVTFDLDWSPFAQATVNVITPATPERVAALDHRLRPKLKVEAGYAYQDGVIEWTTLLEAYLQDATEPVPHGSMRLTAAGAETIPQDREMFAEGNGVSDGYVVRTGVAEFLRSWINRGYEPGTKPSIVSTIPNGWRPGLVADYLHQGGTFWSAIDGVARSADVRVYDSGLGVWHIEGRPYLSGTSAYLRTGPTGTVLSGDIQTERRRWYNRVEILWRWEGLNGAQNATLGYATVSTGPHAARDADVKAYTEERKGQVSQEQAHAYAATLLRKFLARGRQYSLNAVAAYWLRPGATVKVKVGRMTDYETVLVSSISFKPLTGHMSITTQTPQDFE